MKQIALAFFLIAVPALSGCCVNKVVLSGNGNVESGTVGGTVEVEFCTALEEEVVNQLRLVSEAYRVQWEQCAVSPDPKGCRATALESYQAQTKVLQALLASMKGKPEGEQKRLLEGMLLNSSLKFRQ
jgi:hypothetical protein